MVQQRHFDEELGDLKTKLVRMAGLTEDQIDKALTALPDLQPALDLRATTLAGDLRDSHSRVRVAIGGMPRRGLAVDPILPVDVLGVYVYLPQVTG